MKKLIIFLSIAAVMASACTKVVSSSVENGNQISFQTVAGLNTKAHITGTAFPTTETFSTYAWAEGTVGEYFMDNVTIEYKTADNMWKPQETFYWPKNTTVDFISYYPTGLSSITVEKNKITYSGIDVNTFQNDIMYADKAVGFSDNKDLVDDSISGFTGVPTIFRHALAKLSFKVQANFTQWHDDATNSDTAWEITLNSFKIGGFKTTGDLALALNADGKSWDKPETTVDAVKYYVWTNLSGATADQELIDPSTYPSGVALTTSAQDLTPATGYVMPQVLAAGAQTVDIDAHIKTTLANGKTIEEDFVKTINISEISTLKAWQMNENIVYTIKFKPTAHSTEPGVTPHDDDPEDVIIKFDPAVADWTAVDAAATIQI